MKKSKNSKKKKVPVKETESKPGAEETISQTNETETPPGETNPPEGETPASDEIAQTVAKAAPDLVETEIECRGIVIEENDGKPLYSGCGGGEDCPVCHGTGKEKVMVPASEGRKPEEPAGTFSPDAMTRMLVVPAPMNPEAREKTIRDITNAEKRAYDLEAERSAMSKSYKAQIEVEQKAMHDLCETLRAESLREVQVKEIIFWKLGKVVRVNSITREIVSERDITQDDQPLTTDTPCSRDDVPEKFRSLVFGEEPEAAPVDAAAATDLPADPLPTPIPDWMTDELAAEIKQLRVDERFSFGAVATEFAARHEGFVVDASEPGGEALCAAAMSFLGDDPAAWGGTSEPSDSGIAA